jgi:hypothetical protein
MKARDLLEAESAKQFLRRLPPVHYKFWLNTEEPNTLSGTASNSGVVTLIGAPGTFEIQTVRPDGEDIGVEPPYSWPEFSRLLKTGKIKQGAGVEITFDREIPDPTHFSRFRCWYRIYCRRIGR